MPSWAPKAATMLAQKVDLAEFCVAGRGQEIDVVRFVGIRPRAPATVGCQRHSASEGFEPIPSTLP